MQRAVSKFVPADDLVVPYTATSLDDCESIIHIIRMTENELRKNKWEDFIETSKSILRTCRKQKFRKRRGLEGATKGRDERMFTILECHVDVDLEGFEDLDPTSGEPTGIKLPYIVAIEEGTRKVLSIRRNYDVKDVLKRN